MSGDYTRFTFDPTKVFSGVHKQQGRVSLDADFNEFEEILDRRDRSEMYDTVGHAVVPATTPDGFAIGIDGTGKLTIGIGRVYLDGLQPECFGDMSDPAKTAFDAAMGDVVGAGPLPFDAQPFHYSTAFPSLSPTAATVNLVYLDAWQREVTAWEDVRLLDVALGGPDTAARVQTAWQVKVLQPVASDACTNPPQAWTDLTAPSTARMTAAASAAPPPMGPCVIQPAGGYTGLENRLYRVEVHKAGTLGGATPATFKWSRDNASLVASVTAITATATGSVITVDSTGRDTWMRFEVSQQVELLDDLVEFAMRESGVGGSIARITNVNHATGEITIDQNLAAFPVVARQHPRIRRWDTAQLADPAVRNVSNGIAIALEVGISISFGDGTPAHDGDKLHAGDYWVFAARTADGSIDVVDNTPPRGILHHFMPLAIVTSGAATPDQDCRDPWPVPCDCEGGGCECDACVTLDSHMSGALTVQAAVKQVIADGGGTVCIGIGVFPLGDQRIELTNAVTVHVRGRGLATILDYRGVGPAIRIDSAIDVSVRDLALVTERDGGTAYDAIEVSGAALVELERLTVIEDPIGILAFLDSGTAGKPIGGAVGLAGFLLRTSIRDCNLAGGGGVVARSWVSGDASDYLLTADLAIEHDLLFGTTFGIGLGSPQLPGALLLADRTVVRGCSAYGCEDAAIQLSGKVVAGEVLVEDNAIGTIGRGIAIATDSATVADNTVASWAQDRRASGISIVRGDSDRVERVRLTGNRVDGFGLAGVEIDAFVTDVVVAENAVAACGHGIVMALESRGDAVRFVDNRVTDIGFRRGGSPAVFGIAMVNTVDGQVLGNTVARVATEDTDSAWRAGIQAIACRSARIARNTVADIGPSEFNGISLGIGSTAVFERLDVLDNTVQPGEERVLGPWFALLIGGSDDPWAKSMAMIGSSGWWLGGGVATKIGSRDLESEAGVRGNHLDAMGKVSTVEIAIGGSCTFSDNWCRQLVLNGEAVVTIGSEGDQLVALVVASNQVRQEPHDGTVAIDAWVQGAIEPKDPGLAASVLGNITNGIIQVNGAPLTPPWRPLNVRLS